MKPNVPTHPTNIRSLGEPGVRHLDMNFQNKKWNLSRKPNRVERVVGILGATFLIVVFSSGAVAFADLTFRGGEDYLLEFAIITVLTILSGWFLYRVVFGVPEALRHKSASRVAYTFVCIGALAIGAGFSLDGHNTWYLLSVGLVCIGSALANLNRLKLDDA